MTPIEDEHSMRDLPAGTELNILVAEDDDDTRACRRRFDLKRPAQLFRALAHGRQTYT